MIIVVDANESRSGLVALLAEQWGTIEVARLGAGDVAVGDRVLIERKTAEDFLASLSDGRLFRQALEISHVSQRPLLILEGDSSTIAERLKGDQFRGIRLALAVGFRIPILEARDVEDTAAWIRQVAVQEARREVRRQRAAKTRPEASQDPATVRLPREAIRLIREIPGVGRQRARTIAERIGSLRELCRLDLRELMAIPGVGPDTAIKILETLHEGKSRDASGRASHVRRASRPRRECDS